MGRPKDASCESYRLIYDALLNGPKCFEEVCRETGLHRNTVGSRLRYLLEKNLLNRYREGHKVIYEIKKTQPPYYGWEIPWISLMMNREDWRKKWKQIDEEIRVFERQRRWNSLLEQRYKQILQFLELPPNREMLEGFEKAGIDWKNKSLGELLPILYKNLEAPVCPECLQEEKAIIFSIHDSEGGEIICPKCGLILRREPFEVHRPQREQPSPFPPPE